MSSVYKARNWVRWVLVVLGALTIKTMLFSSLPEATPLLVQAINLFQELAHGTATFLLLLPDSKKWFTNASNPSNIGT